MAVLCEHLVSVLAELLPYLGLSLPPPAGESHALQEIILASFGKDWKLECQTSVINMFEWRADYQSQ